MAAKKRKGRKRKPNVKRHPNGKIVQEKPNEVGINARMRVMGMTKKQAKSQEGGNALGIPLDQGEITQAQYDAGMLFLEAREANGKAILALRMRSGSDFGGVGGFDSTDGTDTAYVKRCQRDIEMYKGLRHAVLLSGAFGMMAMEAWIDHSDITLELPYHNLGDYRMAANAINRVIRNKRKAA